MFNAKTALALAAKSAARRERLARATARVLAKLADGQAHAQPEFTALERKALRILVLDGKVRMTMRLMPVGEIGFRL